ncbi:DNA-directed RNA polymerase III, subunit Rpc31 [Artemisia annua]|uniref:DNA-directed RNA polymerase III, subunit Rpc31 n=1 Tax=Artemisia annua TaxID=35608 RepID=A0A2U1LZS9_ARTAN|nr:DNA-directed RNA polymerase III, subunit Rpc31 [Artemisia annua]
MVWRGGRGRGRSGFNSSQRYCKEEPYIMFPEIKEFPAVNPQEIDEHLSKLVSWSSEFQKFWFSSSYHLDDARQGAEKNGGLKRRPLSDYMKMTDDYVPAELVAKNARRNNKKVRWDPQSDLERLDLFEKLDQIKGQDDDDNEKKEDEDEDGEEDDENDVDDEPDGYTENIEFDDDDDGTNQADDGDDEGWF